MEEGEIIETAMAVEQTNDANDSQQKLVEKWNTLVNTKIKTRGEKSLVSFYTFYENLLKEFDSAIEKAIFIAQNESDITIPSGEVHISSFIFSVLNHIMIKSDLTPISYSKTIKEINNKYELQFLQYQMNYKLFQDNDSTKSTIKKVVVILEMIILYYKQSADFISREKREFTICIFLYLLSQNPNANVIFSKLVSLSISTSCFPFLRSFSEVIFDFFSDGNIATIFTSVIEDQFFFGGIESFEQLTKVTPMQAPLFTSILYNHIQNEIQPFINKNDENESQRRTQLMNIYNPLDITVAIAMVEWMQSSYLSSDILFQYPNSFYQSARLSIFGNECNSTGLMNIATPQFHSSLLERLFLCESKVKLLSEDHIRKLLLENENINQSKSKISRNDDNNEPRVNNTCSIRLSQLLAIFISSPSRDVLTKPTLESILRFFRNISCNEKSYEDITLLLQNKVQQ